MPRPAKVYPQNPGTTILFSGSSSGVLRLVSFAVIAATPERPHSAQSRAVCYAVPMYSHRFAVADANALRTSDCEIPNCRAILAGVTPALKAARTAFNFPCVKGTAATTLMRRLGEISAASFLPRRFCSAMTADSNWSSSWSSRRLTALCRYCDIAGPLLAAIDRASRQYSEETRVSLLTPGWPPGTQA